MKDSAYKISLDINGSGSQLVLNARHMDTGRKLYVSLRSGGEPYIIEKNCYAAFAATKPDGTDLYNACEIEGNEIVYEFTEQTCSVVGRSRCEIILYGPDDKVITSPRFALLVDGTICPEGKVVSTDEFTELTHATSEAIEATTAANAAAEEANTASQSAASAAQTALDNANYAKQTGDDARLEADSAYDAASKANAAAGAASQAAGAANSAEQRASDAALDASDAAASAKDATEAANSAASNANQAATKAANTAKSLMVVGKAEGTNIYLDDAIDQFFVGCRIFGKTTQDGTPTPDAPADLVSVGDSGSITVNVSGNNDAQSMTIATPNGLPGVPVASGGNYTDANGQQWVCDEIDFARGKLIVRVFSETITGKHTFKETADYAGRFISDGFLSVQSKNGRDDAISNFAKYEAWAPGSYGECFAISERNLYYYPETPMTADEVTAMFANMIASETPPVVVGQRRNLIEIDLTEEELAAYATLHTYRGNTTVSNDASAHMEIEYVMDAKKYIDSLVAGTGTGTIVPATVE